MSALKLGACALLSLVGASCAEKQGGEEARGDTAVLPSSYRDFLTPSEIDSATEAAGRGDPNAAYKLALHYGSDPRTSLQAEPWLRQAARHNHDQAIQELAVHLFSRGDKVACEEASRWVMALDRLVVDPARRDALAVDHQVALLPVARESCLKASTS
jgi:TPR repeat protein